MAIALFVMISSHIEMFSQRWYVVALVYYGAPFWLAVAGRRVAIGDGA
jgi:hypothetical protein